MRIDRLPEPMRFAAFLGLVALLGMMEMAWRCKSAPTNGRMET